MGIFFDSSSDLTLEDSKIEDNVLREEQKNLRRKIDSIIRTIENLSAKKLSLETEIRVQKKVLARKRLELKKQTRNLNARIKLQLESDSMDSLLKDLQKVQNEDQKLLRESSRLLEE